MSSRLRTTVASPAIHAGFRPLAKLIERPRRPCPLSNAANSSRRERQHAAPPPNRNLLRTQPNHLHSQSLVTSHSTLATAHFYSLHERQSFFTNSLKTKDRSIFYSLQNRPFLKKRRKAKRPFVLSLSNGRTPDERVRLPHRFGGRTVCPMRAFIPTWRADEHPSGVRAPTLSGRVAHHSPLVTTHSLHPTGDSRLRSP